MTKWSYIKRYGLFLMMGITIVLFGNLLSFKVGAQEVSSGVAMSYYNNGSWKGFNNYVADAANITALKLQTPQGGSYFLKYQTQNKTVLDYFSLVDSRINDYAGTFKADAATGQIRTVQKLAIQVFNSAGIKISSGIVVMYRARVGSEWLAWVSNADPVSMATVQAKYNLGGTLDTRGSYAGREGNDITAIEIRVFEESGTATPITLTGAEYNPSMSYGVVGLDTMAPFSSSKTTSPPYTNSIDGIKIQTAAEKQYYLLYQVWGANIGGYYPEVSSVANNSAGAPNDPIQRLKIQVYNKSDGTKVSAGLTVMYRAYVDGAWLSWVSNAGAEWMQSAKIKYHLDGALDTVDGYAGITGKNITAVEIRVFEQTELTSVYTPVGNYKIVETPFISQVGTYPTGCESVSTVMALQDAGINISVDTFIDNYLDKGDSSSFDPNETFGGNPRLSTGMGCYAPVIKNACDKALIGTNKYAEVLYNTPIETLCADYIDNGIPVIFWATSDMRIPYISKTILYNGRSIPWVAPEHCLVLVGYDDCCYIFNDPLKTQPLTYYNKEQVAVAYSGMGSQAEVIKNVPTNPEQNPPAVAEEYVKPSGFDSDLCGDTVDLRTGSHILSFDLLSLTAANNLTVTAEYNSSRLVRGALGVGWYYNFEKRLEVSGSEIWIYETPSVYCRYIATADNNIYTCAISGKNGFILTKQADGSYLLDCNAQGTQAYDAQGKLTAITNKQGIKTTIQYSDTLITVTDWATGQHIYLSKDGTGKIVRIYNDGVLESVLTYSGDYLLTIKNMLGQTVTFTYGENGKIATGNQKDGARLFADYYDLNGRLETQYDTTGSATQFCYSGDARTVTVTKGQSTETAVYNAQNQLISKTDRNGRYAAMAYDTRGNLLQIVYDHKGDINGDARVDIRDLVRMKKLLAGQDVDADAAATDINSDKSSNSDDMVLLRKYLNGSDYTRISCESYTYNERDEITSYTDTTGKVTVYN